MASIEALGIGISAARGRSRGRACCCFLAILALAWEGPGVDYPNWKDDFMRRILIASVLALGCALLATGLSAAQRDGPAQEAETPEERYANLEDAVDEAYGEWLKDLRAKMKEVDETGEELPESAYVRPFAPFIPKFQAAAVDYAGTDDAVPFLLWIGLDGISVDKEAGKAALLTLLDKHAKSEKLEPLATQLPRFASYFEAAELARLLAKLETESPVPVVRGWAMYSLLKKILEEGDLESEEYAQAKAKALAVLETVESPYLEREIKSGIGIREQFSIGMVAPDIVGIDLDGEAFKLSDEKGRVLFVDFWGDW
jgi:hypothetical protein